MGIRFHNLIKVLNLNPDWWLSLNQQKRLLFDCIEREGDLKNLHRNTQNAALNVDLF